MLFTGLHDVTAKQLGLLRELANYYGVRFDVTSGFRSIATQTELYRRRAAGLHPLPVAVPGTSTHNYGLAFDAVARAPSSQADLVALAQAIGLVWAGPRDPVHFQVIRQDDWSRLVHA